MKEDSGRKEELLGKTVYGVTYFLFALKVTALFSAAALAVLFIAGKPLWLSPLIGIACFLVYRFFRILILRLLIRFGRWGSE